MTTPEEEKKSQAEHKHSAADGPSVQAHFVTWDKKNREHYIFKLLKRESEAFNKSLT